MTINTWRKVYTEYKQVNKELDSLIDRGLLDRIITGA